MAAQSLPPQLPPTPALDVMEMLRNHVPLMLFVDVAFPSSLVPD